MMETAEFLTTIAELSIALIAFSTIVVAIRQMGGGALDEFQLHIVKLFSLCGFAALFFSLLPILLSFFEVPGSLIYRICNPLLGLSILLIHSWYFRHRRRLAPERKLNATNLLNIVTMVIAVVLLALGTAGIAFAGSVAPYAFALVGLLLASATAFLRTLRDFLSASH